MSEKRQKEQEKTSLKLKVMNIIGTILCIILLPILLINITLIIKSYTNADEVPKLGGYFPLIVLTDSMYPEIHAGDLIICHQGDAEELEEGDIIAFYDPAWNGTTIVTHRIEAIVEGTDGLEITTKGDANNVADALTVPEEDVVGEYLMRIPNIGNVAMFMQTSTGLIVCVVLPLILMIAYDMIRRKQYEKKNRSEADELRAELEALKAARQKESEKE